ncbi:MAG: hypothetical protein IJO40_14750 [Thermoguttaceae bacterium]|nr:hypothetical protein [Thermoguttaceae bacterium]
MNDNDKLTAEKLYLLSVKNATGYGLYLLGFTEALRLRDYTAAMPLYLPTESQDKPRQPQ